MAGLTGPCCASDHRRQVILDTAGARSADPSQQDSDLRDSGAAAVVVQRVLLYASAVYMLYRHKPFTVDDHGVKMTVPRDSSEHRFILVKVTNYVTRKSFSYGAD
jgi:hypothetical protein